MARIPPPGMPHYLMSNSELRNLDDRLQHKAWKAESGKEHSVIVYARIHIERSYQRNCRAMGLKLARALGHIGN